MAETEAEKKKRLKKQQEEEERRAGDPGYSSTDSTNEAVNYLNTMISSTSYDSTPPSYDSGSSSFGDAGAGFGSM